MIIQRYTLGPEPKRISRNFEDNTSNFLHGTEITVVRPISVGVWFKDNGVANDDSGIYNNADGASIDPNFYIGLHSSSSNHVQRLYSGAYAGDSNSWAPDEKWHHLGWTWDTNDFLFYYLDGVANGNFTRTSGGTVSTGSHIGKLRTTLFPLDGSLADFAVWNGGELLVESDFLKLYKGWSPQSVKRPSLVMHTPLNGTGDERSLIGTSFTENGTVASVASRPLIRVPGRRPVFIGEDAVAAGGLSIPVRQHHLRQMRLS